GAVEDEADDRLVSERSGIPCGPVALHLAPYSAHGVFAHAARKQRGQRPTNPACVSSGQIAARNQCISCQRTPLIGAKRTAPPFGRRAIRLLKPGARNCDLRLAERASQRPLPASVAMADGRLAPLNTDSRVLTSTVTRTRQHCVKFAANHLLNETPDPFAD